jgi:hypothetical protein
VSITVTVPTVVTETETTAITTTTTALTTIATTTTVTCAAAPTPPITCGLAAYGFGTYLISQTPLTDPTTCHAKCLADVNCKSFQVQLGGMSYCNLYNAPTAGNVQPAPGDEFFFYDRNCPDYQPVRICSFPLEIPKEKNNWLTMSHSLNAQALQQRRREHTPALPRLTWPPFRRLASAPRAAASSRALRPRPPQLSLPRPLLRQRQGPRPRLQTCRQQPVP